MLEIPFFQMPAFSTNVIMQKMLSLQLHTFTDP